MTNKSCKATLKRGLVQSIENDLPNVRLFTMAEKQTKPKALKIILISCVSAVFTVSVIGALSVFGLLKSNSTTTTGIPYIKNIMLRFSKWNRPLRLSL